MARQMKDSGIEWIGEIPVHYQKFRIKNVAELHGRIGFRGYTTDDLVGVGEGPITLSPSNIKDMSMSYSKCSYITWEKYDESPEIQVHNGDILMVKTGSSYGKTAMVTGLPMEATINPQLIVMNNFKVVPRFLNYCFHTEIILSQVENAVVGGTIPTMAQEKINNFFFFAPPLAEQKRITDFLDRKCAEIDAVIERTKATIEEYKKLKQAVITEAVTKGVRGPRPMKDSGIEWIREIPEEWDIVPLQYHVDTNVNSLGEDTPPDYEFDYVEIGSVTLEGGINQYEHVHFSDAPSRARRIVKENDIIISTVRTYLKAIAIVPARDNVVVSTGFAVLTPRGIDVQFLGFFLKSEYFVNMVTANSFGISYPAINASALVKFKILLPPPTEQQQIADYLDEKCSVLDTLIAKKTALLTELETYKKSLIYEYVTGKKEI